MSAKWWVLAAVACGTFMATLDSSIVNIALPTLTGELHADLYRTKWVVIVYLLIITFLLLPFGRLSDQYGRKKVFLFGFLVFTVGSALCGLSPGLDWLLFSRAFQGAGAAMLMANGPAVITASFTIGERGKALGTLAMVVSAGLISGPSIGGFLITHFGWKSIFLINIPVGIVGMYLVFRAVPSDLCEKAPAPFDWAGAILQMFLLLSFIVLVDPPVISMSGSIPFHISRLVLLILVLVFGALFVKVESDAQAPLFDLQILKIRTFWTANLASFLNFVAYSCLSVLMPFFLEEVIHFTPADAGLVMTAIPLTVFVVAPISGRLSDRLGTRGLSLAGATVLAIGLFVMAGIFGLGIHEGISTWTIVFGLSTIGLSTGLFQSPNNNAIMTCVPVNKLGVASAMLATVRNLGMVTGTGLGTGIFTWRMKEGANFVDSLHFTFYIAGTIAIGAMVAAMVRRPDAAKQV